MLKSSSSYVVIVLSLLIVLSSMSFLIVAYRYRYERLQNIRQRTLENGFKSACAVIVSDDFPADDRVTKLALFEEPSNSCESLKGKWGIYQYAAMKYFVNSDTLKKSFLIGVQAMRDSSALYISDEDRPVSLSGCTVISGDAEVPSAGFRRSYVDGNSFKGDTLVHGKTLKSEKMLPELSVDLLKNLNQYFFGKSEEGELMGATHVSFFQPAKILNIPRGQESLNGISLKGKIILHSDTSLSLGKGARLEDVIVCARSVIIEAGFRGSCQIFALDSIVCRSGSILDYPSVLGLLHEDQGTQGIISLHAGSQITGTVFAWQDAKAKLRNVISIARGANVLGDVYSSGIIKLDKGSRIQGKIWCNRILMQIRGVMYENYLVDVMLDRLGRNKYYLRGELFKKREESGILRWLD